MIAEKNMNIGKGKAPSLSFRYVVAAVGGSRFFMVSPLEKRNKKFSYSSSCRELISPYFKTSTPFIGFSSLESDIVYLNAFFQIIENKLGLKKHTIFHRTSVAGAIVAEVPTWWRKTLVRREFFTLFLRFGALYYRGSLSKDIQKYHLYAYIRTAVNRFLNGNTVDKSKQVVSGFDGIVKAFSGKTASQLRSMLVKG